VEDGREMFSHRAFVVAAYRGEHPTSVHCGILMIDAGGQGQDNEEFLGMERITSQVTPILVAGSSFGPLRVA
jgi:hypothetical protein